MILLFLLAMPTAAPVRSEPRDLPPAATAPAADELVLDWPVGTDLSMTAVDGETVLRFDRAPDVVALDAFRRSAGGDLMRMDWNDVSMVIRPAQGRRFVATVSGHRLTIRVIRDVAPVADGPAPGAVDYALAQVAAETAAGYPGRARRRLTALAGAWPDDPQVARSVADVDAARGATRRAARRYRVLGATDLNARRTLRGDGGQMAATALVRGAGGFRQWDTGLAFTAPVAATAGGIDTGIGGAVRWIGTRADAVVTRSGLVEPLRRNVTLVELTGSLGNAATRLELTGAATLSRSRAGIVARLIRGVPEREWRLLGAWHLPDVLTAEQVLLGGSVDRLGAGATMRLSPAIQVQGDVVRTAYALRHEGRRATSTGLTAGVDATLRRLNPSIGLLYRLEAEYVERLDRRPGGAASLPLADRENHTAQALVAEQLGPWRLAAAAGWTFDRFGGNGPTAALTVTGLIGDAWQLDGIGGVSSIQRPNLIGTQLYARISIRHGMGRRS